MILTTEEAADYLNISVSMLKRLKSQGKIEPYRTTGRKNWWHVADLEAVRSPAVTPASWQPGMVAILDQQQVTAVEPLANDDRWYLVHTANGGVSRVYCSHPMLLIEPEKAKEQP